MSPDEKKSRGEKNYLSAAVLSDHHNLELLPNILQRLGLGDEILEPKAGDLGVLRQFGEVRPDGLELAELAAVFAAKLGHLGGHGVWLVDIPLGLLDNVEQGGLQDTLVRVVHVHAKTLGQFGQLHEIHFLHLLLVEPQLRRQV